MLVLFLLYWRLGSIHSLHQTYTFCSEETMSESSLVTIETNENAAHHAVCNDQSHCECGDTKEPIDITVDVVDKEETLCPKKRKLQQWLNKNLRIEMTDGRTLIGVFLCTDRDSNIILGSCSEFLTTPGDDARILGLVMIPGRHIVSIQIESSTVETP